MPKWLVRAVAVVVIASLWWGVGAVGAASVDAATGPDVASWQHPNGAPIDWGQVRAAGHDFAFAVMGPGGHSGSASLEATVGGTFGIAFNSLKAGDTVTALGYPAQGEYDGTDLTYCQGNIGQDSRIANATWRLACDMTGGSSGGGWLTGSAGSFSAVLQSLNSYGYTGETAMYGPKFNSRTEAVYNAANTATSNTVVSSG